MVVIPIPFNGNEKKDKERLFSRWERSILRDWIKVDCEQLFKNKLVSEHWKVLKEEKVRIQIKYLSTKEKNELSKLKPCDVKVKIGRGRQKTGHLCKYQEYNK